MDLPFSLACERNKAPILAALKPLLAGKSRVLEIGSGTGQHAVYFAGQLPWLSWQTTELAGGVAQLAARLAQQGGMNLPAPVELDVMDRQWPAGPFDAVFTANTLHIMSWAAVAAAFAEVGRVLTADGLLCVYGPFNYAGRYTSASNAEFDAMLRARDPQSGIRDFEAVDEQASLAGLTLEADSGMPANNRLLCWRRTRQV